MRSFIADSKPKNTHGSQLLPKYPILNSNEGFSRGYNPDLRRHQMQIQIEEECVWGGTLFVCICVFTVSVCVSVRMIGLYVNVVHNVRVCEYENDV